MRPTFHGIDDVVLGYDFSRDKGGISHVIARQAEVLIDHGLRVHFITADDAEAELLPAAVRVRVVSRAAVEGVGRVRRGVATIRNRAASAGTHAVLARMEPSRTVVHFHGWTMALSAWPIRTAHSLGFPTVVSCHDFSIACPTGVYYDFSTDHECVLRPMSGACARSSCDRYGRTSKTQRFARRLVEDHIVGMRGGVDAFAAVSRSLRSVLLDWDFPGSRVFMLENPRPRSHEPARPWANTGVLFVGRLAREKGVIDLADVCRKLDIPLCVCGDGPLRDTLARSYQEVVLEGWLSANEVRERMTQARLLVVPSRWCEASGLVVDEAWSVGLPCLVADRSGAAEKIEVTGAGGTFRRGSTDALYNAMEAWYFDPAMIERAALAARSMAAALDRDGTRYAVELSGVYAAAMDHRLSRT